jgi:hypothetical protein
VQPAELGVEGLAGSRSRCRSGNPPPSLSLALQGCNTTPMEIRIDRNKKHNNRWETTRKTQPPVFLESRQQSLSCGPHPGFPVCDLFFSLSRSLSLNFSRKPAGTRAYVVASPPRSSTHLQVWLAELVPKINIYIHTPF